MIRLLPILLCLACAEIAPDKPDSGEDAPEVPSCAPEDHDALTLVIGTGQGGQFTPLEDGASVTLDVAPQGGFGVSVRAKTTGLNTDAPVDVLLETALDGTESGSFVNEGTNLYCQDDGSGLLWGVVVGFDPDTFPNTDALLALDGEEALLIVQATDVDGRSARSELSVTIEVGG